MCGSCHEEHMADWEGSMHAYATVDPVFRAMVVKGMMETQGKLDQFCIQCHAPMASKAGLTPIENMDTPDAKMKLDMEHPLVGHGVVCVTCHTADSVQATLNAEFTVQDNFIAGPTGSAAANEAHPTQKSEVLSSATLCGACHNVVNPKGALLENTFSEWYAGEFNDGVGEDKDCVDCHMPVVTGEIVAGKEAQIHRHTFVGVDLALVDDFPDKERQRRLVEELLRSAGRLTVTRAEDLDGHMVIRAAVTNINNGHALPSGSTADRQVWVHLTAKNEDGEVLFETGMLDANGDLMDRVTGHSLTPDGDPDLLLLGSLIFSPDGEHVTFPWQAQTQEDALLQPGQTAWREYEIPTEGYSGRVTIEARLRYRTFPPFLVRQLIDEGFLGEGEMTEIPIVDMAEVTKEYDL